MCLQWRFNVTPYLHLRNIVGLTGFSSFFLVFSQDDAEREMDDDKRPLSYFALASGNVILVRLG